MRSLRFGIVAAIIGWSAIASASEVAEMILRIDDVIASSAKRGPQMPPGGMEGMGDMGGMM